MIDTFLKTQEEIVTWMGENHDEVIAMAAEELGLDAEAVESMYGTYDFTPAVSDEDVASLQKTADFMYARRHDPRALRRIRPVPEQITS